LLLTGGNYQVASDYAPYRTLQVGRSGTVLTLRLNRPEHLNAVNAEMHRELSTIFADVGADKSVNAIIITGEGRAFCAGGDVEWMRDMTPAGLIAMFQEARKIIIDLLELEVPVIAAVNGHAIGLGATLALFSDVIYMAPEAKVGDPHVRLGICAGDGGAVIWPWLVGMVRAKELLMTGDLIDAATAERFGLVNHVVPADRVLTDATALAERLAAGAPIAIRATKASVNKLLRDSVNLVLDTSLAREHICFHSADHREAVAAFLEKRRPAFSGA
jgi:enoyl-CoA hydratase